MSIKLRITYQRICLEIWTISTCTRRIQYANWIADSEESKSTSGYVFTLGGATVSWKCSKQICIARSTIESEFIA